MPTQTAGTDPVADATAGAGASPPQEDSAEAALTAELPRLRALSYSILRDADQTADAVQDTMEQALRSWTALRRPDRRAAWLSTICVRQSLRRARARRVQQLLPWTSASQTPLETTDIDLERALHALTPKQRAVVALHYIYGFTLDETAAVMRCRPGTARSHLHRALHTLREHLEENE